MSDARHPDITTLADWLDGRLEPGAADQVAAAVTPGSAAAADVVWLRRVHAAGRAMPLERPPQAVQDRLRGLLRDRHGYGVRSVAEWPAHLVFDSRRDAALAGVRGGAEDAVHLAYTVEQPAEGAATGPDSGAIDVLLDAERLSRGTVHLTGQVLCATAAPTPFTEARVGVGDEVVSAASIDTLGRFDLGTIDDRATELRIRSADAVLVATLELRAWH